MNKNKLMLGVALIAAGAIVASCTPARPPVGGTPGSVPSYPSRAEEISKADYDSVRSAALAAYQATNAYTLDLKMDIDSNAALTSSMEAMNLLLDMNLGLTAVAEGLNADAVDDLGFSVRTNGNLDVSGLSSLMSTNSISTPLEAGIFLQDGTAYADISKIDLDSLVDAGLATSSDLDLPPKFYQTGAVTASNLKQTQDELRSMVNVFDKGEEIGNEVTYYSYGNGMVGYESDVSISKVISEASSALIAAGQTEAAMMVAFLGTAMTVKDSSIRQCCSSSAVQGELSLEMELNIPATATSGKQSVELDVSLSYYVQFLDNIDIQYPTDLDTYVAYEGNELTIA